MQGLPLVLSDVGIRHPQGGPHRASIRNSAHSHSDRRDGERGNTADRAFWQQPARQKSGVCAEIHQYCCRKETKFIAEIPVNVNCRLAIADKMVGARGIEPDRYRPIVGLSLKAAML